MKKSPSGSGDTVKDPPAPEASMGAKDEPPGWFREWLRQDRLAANPHEREKRETLTDAGRNPSSGTSNA